MISLCSPATSTSRSRGSDWLVWYCVEEVCFGGGVLVHDLFDFAFLDQSFEFGPERCHGGALLQFSGFSTFLGTGPDHAFAQGDCALGSQAQLSGGLCTARDWIDMVNNFNHLSSFIFNQT